jgi:hypothetical protein
MLCPKCAGKAKIIDSRRASDNMTRRRYSCLGRCGIRWSTVEVFSHFGGRPGNALSENVAQRLEKRAKKAFIEKLGKLLEDTDENRNTGRR